MIASNTLYQLLGRVATAAVALIVTRLITSAIGLQGYGEYQIIVGFVSLFWILTDFGLNSIAVRQISAEPAKKQTIFSLLLTLRIILGILLTVFALIVLIFLPYALLVKIGIFIAVGTILTNSILGATHAVFQSQLTYNRQLLGQTIGALVLLFTVFLAIYLNWGILGLAVSFLVGYSVMAVAQILLTHSFVKFSLNFDLSQLKELFLLSLPVGIALWFSLGVAKIDSFLLSFLPLPFQTNAEAVGIYQLAYKVFDLILVAPIFFMNVMYPILSRLFGKDREAFLQRFWQTLGLLFLGSLGVLGTLLVLSPFIISLIAQGEAFSPSITVLRILSFFVPLFFLTAPLMWVLVIINKQRTLAAIYGLGFALNLTLNLIFIPRYSFWAATWITGATELLILTLLAASVGYYWKQMDSSF